MKEYELVKCGKCGHQWKVAKSEWLVFNLATGKIPHCPKCGASKIFWGEQKPKKTGTRA
jgi:NAD-dependent SIR2 family protein deacetylase